jgi:BirA family biotin operon repressor/biotin-[acetyl-CoA-carboxylase] ligase
MLMDDDLREPVVGDKIPTKWLGQSYTYLESVPSTNDLLKEMVAQGNEQDPPAGTVILTDFQTQGRGRLNRRWQTPPKSALLLSMLFRPHWPAEQANWLTMITGLAAAEAIEARTGLAVHIKWPNDLVIQIGVAWHKVSGLLLEGRVDEYGRLPSAVLGIGINVNIPSDQLPPAVTPATSLLVAGGRPVSRSSLLMELLQRIEKYYETAVHGQSPHTEWRQRLMTLGQSVRVTSAETGTVIAGKAAAIDAWGHLIVQEDDGQRHTVTAGDVTLR